MEHMNRYANIAPILAAVDAGDYAQAKALIQDKCRTLPERQARRLGQTIGALMDRRTDIAADSAVILLNMFDN